MKIENPVSLDPWATSSLLQKAIRRGDETIADHAAKTLYRYRGSAIWRRFAVIAIEDIGIADIDLVAQVVQIGTDKPFRHSLGSDLENVERLTRMMAKAAKDRSTDYLAYIAQYHLDMARDREAIAGLMRVDRIPIALDPDQSLIRRAIAALYLSGITLKGALEVRGSYVPRLLKAMDATAVPHWLPPMVETAFRWTGEPIAVMLPLLWLRLRECDRPGKVVEVQLPAAPTAHGIPLYTFDLHTRIGKQAAAIFVRENDELQSVLIENVPDFRMRDVAGVAIFYLDAAPISRRLDWEDSCSLEALGLEADMMKVGCPKHAILPIMDAVRANMDHLNGIRARLLGRSSSLHATRHLSGGQ